MNEDKPRLIEVAFPLKQASIDSVHEKNVRHGHISTLHIWPARRPLAASRAALIATLLPDPGNEAERKKLLEKLGGVVKTRDTFKNVGGRKVRILKEETEGGILHWGRENNPDLEFFREEIKKAYGGRAPRVLDPFAGGGAIPLEAMRLGCEVTAIDINPVAWFILKCTLEYPQRLAGQKRPLPRFALDSPEFMEEFWKATGNGRKGRKGKEPSSQPSMLEAPEADLSWHVRAWGYWVLERAKKDLERFYPVIDGKPTVAYLWARTVTCKNCRATLPLLKTLWLCKKDNKRIRLKMKPRSDRSGVDFEVVKEPLVGGNAAQRRAHDQQAGQGTMTRSGAWCPVCGTIGAIAMTRDDIQADLKAQNLKRASVLQMTAVVVEGKKGKEYRPPTPDEITADNEAASLITEIYRKIPFGLPQEEIHNDAKGSTWCVQYGFDTFDKLFTPRQLTTLGTFTLHTIALRDALKLNGYPNDWIEALVGYLCMAFDRTCDRASSLCTWTVGWDKIGHTFVRFALPVTWDFVESVPTEASTGGYPGAIEWVSRYVAHALNASNKNGTPSVLAGSAATGQFSESDIVVTDPPYYDAIPYSNTMDFFYVWLRRNLHGLSPVIDSVFSKSNSPKWDENTNDGELVDDASRFGGDSNKSKSVYEEGMFRAFSACNKALKPEGRMVVVFANKQPDAWETLVSSMIRAGFVVDGSWPIQTEMGNRMRALTSAALSSSVWLVCRKRLEIARPGWDNQVIEEMKANIHTKLRQFWDAGIRGPDFVWAATGPALEAYSKHPVVKKADQPNSVLTVTEFLHHVRRIVVDYVVGRVLSRNGESAEAESLDNLTIYYLLHRHDFGLEEAPVGACILYAQSCNLHDRDLADRYDLLAYGKGKSQSEADDEETEGEEDEPEEESPTSGSTLKLKRWEQRNRKDLGLPVAGQSAPLIDQIHHIMHLWKAGDVQKVDNYLEDQGLRRNPLFSRVLQAIVELARKDNQSDEVSLLESIMNHITARGIHPQMRLMTAEE
jgi:adenine-specific DNA methylase